MRATMSLSKACVLGALLLAGVLGAVGCGDRSTAAGENGGAAQLAALERRIAAAAATAERVQAVGAVKRLQHAYGHYSELGLWHDFADLFSDTAVGHYVQGDLGKEEIRKLFVDEVGQGIVGLAEGRIYPHIALSPVVTLAPDAQSAKARWRIVAMLGGYGRSASWARGVYENSYVKESGVWKVQEIAFFNQVSGRYGESLRPTVDGPLDQPTLAFHYASADVGASLAAAAAATAAVAEPFEQPSFDALAARVSELEPAVARLAAEAAVSNLQNAYGYYADRKLWDDVADLFADDGTLEIGRSGVYVGKASIRRALDRFGAAGLRDGEINDAIDLQPIVTVAADGASAKMRGGYLAMTGQVGEGAQWRQGLYENEYVRDGGVWKIDAMHVYPRLVTDYDRGWALDAQPLAEASAEFPPDRPPTAAYESYPKFVIPPFHFRHPVTGRSPQYPSTHEGGDPSVAVEALPAATAALTAAELDARLTALERELTALDAAAAAQNLLNAYGYYADEHMWSAAAQLFASDAWAEVPGAGVYVGRERIRGALQAAHGARRTGAFELHQIAQPVIHSSPSGAEARVRARLAKIDATGEEDVYAAGIYEAAVRIEDGAWRIGALDLDWTWAATHSRGWARVEPGESARLTALPTTTEMPPPDRPASGPAAAPFPAIEDVAFHYVNPVSGRSPARDAF